MKEITRIHLAKVAYDIEIDAKKDIQNYINSLETYASDSELLSDIEIRITELLAERGVQAGGVITKEDVAGVRERLGEPSDFAGDESILPDETTVSSPRRMYRDENGAILGGVLAGFGRYFGIEPVWLRIVFIVLLFGSFGTVLLLYAILWLIIPPARTAAEKLQMNGQPVTLASIKGLAGNEEQRNERAQTMQRALGGLAGVLLIAAAIAGLIAVVVAVFGVSGREVLLPGSDRWVLESWWLMVAMGLFVLSGLLFSAFCFLLASAAFRRQWSKRLSLTTVIIIVAGLVTFAGGMTAGYIGVESERKQIEAAMVETKVELPSTFKDVKHLVASAHTVSSDNEYGYTELRVEYRVDTSRAPRYELTALPDIKPDIRVEDGEARVVLKSSVSQQRAYGWVRPELVIYGPALDEVTVEQGVFEYIAAMPSGQENLKITTLATTQTAISGKFATLTVGGAGEVDATSSSVANVIVASEAGAVIRAGVVRSLNVTQPDVCPADNWMGNESKQNQVIVRSVSGSDFSYNNTIHPVGSMVGPCGQVVIGNEILDEEW